MTALSTGWNVSQRTSAFAAVSKIGVRHSLWPFACVVRVAPARLATLWLHRAKNRSEHALLCAKESPRNSRRGRSLEERRARGSNPQPLTGHHISSVAANHSLTLLESEPTILAACRERSQGDAQFGLLTVWMRGSLPGSQRRPNQAASRLEFGAVG